MHYFDHAATTPMRQAAIDAWVRHSQAVNPGGQYGSGRRARSVLDDAREQIAGIMGAEPIEVIFTASGTEADNIAIHGLYRASELSRIVSTPIEHPAVKEVVEHLVAEEGAEAVLLPVDRHSHVSDLSALDVPAAVATCMYANNETGAIQPIPEIIARAAAVGTPVHVDAVQAVGRVPIHFHDLGATTLASSAHKYGGPRGVGFLLAKRSPAPTAILHGGGQERGIRPGTVDVASAAAMAAALQEAVDEMVAANGRISALRDELRERILAAVDDVRVNTAEPALPGHLHLSFPGADGDSMIMLLDSLGVEAATGSACSSGVSRMSHVLEAMGVADAEGIGSLRFTLGRTTTAEDVEYLAAHIAEVVEKARRAGLR
ncbi:cysteine desulfurase family protein [Corynebacterium guangdongense]|uniref:Cysteine desulfurase n=1 Tax=Corynebacterium guangdongense TaxID=1783348 RepID=A0ABU1ZW22_9CORY|nr:cysteine desulfurase family protein [Corynebacterium guangdongense]MDR7329139.1 cysteine desulfurase [Corynebacterium guangdongense]WJZ17708.1 Cysteine desulfurase [Corynebacterium guangdongense]